MFAKRLFTIGMIDPFDSCRFVARPVETPKGEVATIDVPDDWSLEAASAFAATLYARAPLERRALEENTLPSWLWKRRAAGQGYATETSAEQVFNRIAGSAAYAGWKKGLWDNEGEARAFRDEICFLLARRYFTLEPERMAGLGTDWAYGEQLVAESHLETSPALENVESLSPENKSGVAAVQNATVDAILSSADPLIRTRWQRFLRGGRERNALSLRFADTVAEWGLEPEQKTAPHLMIDLFRFRREDGTMDLPALRQAVRLAVVLLEIHYGQLDGSSAEAMPLAIGYGNMAALLMSLGLAYDSREGRSTAAAISAIITAEAASASARLAEQLGPCPAFSKAREISLRALRNYRRASYGERNDYERLSVLPLSLNVEDGADLVLVAAARHAWDNALELAGQHGLRHMQLTALFETPSLAVFLECSAQGIEPETHLVRQYAVLNEDGHTFRRTIHPAVPLALEKAGCEPGAIKAIVTHAVGYGTLKAAPGVNHTRLRERGFDTEALARVENYLPNVNDIRTLFTPWILGEYFCRYVLKVNERNLNDLCFNVLHHLGFSEADIAAANAYCCGYGTVSGAAGLTEKAEKLFAPENASTKARIRMAAAAQGFITGDVNLVLSLPAQTSQKERSAILLSGWRQGLKSMSLYFEGSATLARHGLRAAASKLHGKILRQKPAMPKPVMRAPAPMMPRTSTTSHMAPRTAKPRATTRATSLRRGSSKTGVGAGTKRD
ncbi:MAG: hypothetical protein PHY92_10385 [Alphaproteobacteria bacterium]|nr:hypothetical protein [Alphaproteobacteria bacterium]